MASNCNSSFSIKQDDNNPDVSYRLRTEWENNKRCNIVVLGGTAAYCGQITEEEIERMSEMTKRTRDAYVEECKSSFHPNSSPGLYTYAIEQDTFVVKKIMKRGKLRLVNVVLKSVDFQEAIYEMLDASMKRITDMTAELENSRRENETIQRNYEIAVQRLEEMVQLKTQCDKISSIQFLNLLNSKKAKLARLENRQSTSSENQRAESLNIDHVMSDDSAYSIETDEMETDDESPPREPSTPHIEGTRTTNFESAPNEQERSNDGKESEPLISSEVQIESPVLNHEQLSIYSEAMGLSDCNEKRNESLSAMDVASSSKTEAVPSNTHQSSIIESYLNMDLLDPTVRLKKK